MKEDLVLTPEQQAIVDNPDFMIYEEQIRRIVIDVFSSLGFETVETVERMWNDLPNYRRAAFIAAFEAEAPARLAAGITIGGFSKAMWG